MDLGHIGTGPRDAMAPSAITWTTIYGRLGTRRLGTAFLWLGKCCVLFLLDLYIYFRFPLARLEWSYLLKLVRFPLQCPMVFPDLFQEEEGCAFSVDGGMHRDEVHALG
jgi:hypothetical protein